MTPEAVDQLERALALDPRFPGARYFLGLAAAQHDDAAKAREIWTSLLPELPPESPTRKNVEEKLALLDKPADAAPPGGAAADDQAIRAMVDKMAARLSSRGGSAEEWRELIRSYAALHDAEKARSTLAAAGKGGVERPRRRPRTRHIGERTGVRRAMILMPPKIMFDGRGRVYPAERPAPTGAQRCYKW